MAGSSSTMRMCADAIGMSVRGRQQQRERAAAPGFALHTDLAAVCGHDLLHDGESDTGALDIRLERGASAHELAEDALLLGLRNADPPVDDTDRRVILVLAPPHPDGRFARRV